MRETPEQTDSSPTTLSFPKTSLTICSRNRPKLLLETVESVLQGNDLPSEIVIVDQSDTPHPTLGSLKASQNCEIRYFWTHTRGVSQARNQAIAAAQYDLLALTDDDMYVTPTWFGALIRALLAAGPRSVVTGRVLSTKAETPGHFAPSIKDDQTPVVYKGRVGTDVLYTGNMAMYRSVLNDLGVFDERLGTGSRFPAAYDNDFGFRLLEAGYRILYVPEAVLYHRAWRSEQDYLRLRWNYGRGQGAFYAKHLSLRDHYILRRMIGAIGPRLFQIPLNLRRHKRHLAYGDAMYILGFLSGVGEWLLTQRKKGLSDGINRL